MLKALKVPTHKHSEGSQIQVVGIFVNNTVFSSQRILCSEVSKHTEDGKVN